MAACYVAVPESPRLDNTPFDRGLMDGPSRSDTPLSSTSYRPIGPGKWILSMHGNCPHCHHQHTAVQVKVEVARDTSHVSYVDCERCNGKWLAFSQNNSTRLSLLSTTTTKRESIEEDVRQHFIRIIRRTTTEPDMSNQGIPSDDGFRRTRVESDLYARETEPGLDSIPEDSVTLLRTRSRRILKRVRAKRDVHLPTFRRSNMGWPFRRTAESNISTRQQQRPTTRVLDTADGTSRALNQPLPSDNGTEGVSTRTNTPVAQNINATPDERDMSQVLPSLDTSILDTMNRQARSAWARQQYTGFQRRNRGPVARLGYSTIHSVQNNHHRRAPRTSWNRHSLDIIGTGGGIAEMVRLSLPYAASIAAIDPITIWTLDAVTSSPRLGSIPNFSAGRPLSVPNPIMHSPQFRHLQGSRTSNDSFGYASITFSRNSSMVAHSILSSEADTLAAGSESMPDLNLFHEVTEREQTDIDDTNGASSESQASESTLRDPSPTGSEEIQHEA